MEESTEKMSDSKPKQLKKCCYIQPPVRESMKLKALYEQPTEPFADETTYHGAYLPIDPKTAADCQMDAVKPMSDALQSNVQMDMNTVYRLSYQPVETKQRVIPSWALKSKYEQPAIPMDLNTIYGGSYMLPGKFVECDEGAPDNLIVTYAENCDDIEGLIRVHDSRES